MQWGRTPKHEKRNVQAAKVREGQQGKTPEHKHKRITQRKQGHKQGEFNGVECPKTSTRKREHCYKQMG